jgi:cytochrome c553
VNRAPPVRFTESCVLQCTQVTKFASSGTCSGAPQLLQATDSKAIGSLRLRDADRVHSTLSGDPIQVGTEMHFHSHRDILMSVLPLAEPTSPPSVSIMITTQPLRLSLTAVVLIAGASSVSAEKPPNSAGVEFFEKKIRPVLVQHCYSCHSATAKSVKGKLLLDTRDGIRKGGETGPAVVPKNVKKSLLLEALRYESLEMPPTGKLSKRVIADFETWIKLGAPDPRDGKTAPVAKRQARIDFDKARRFWAFQAPKRYSPPQVKQTSWIRKPIDAFVLAKLEAAGMRPNEPADRRTLIRRLSFDLIGLPPTPEQVGAFVNDRSPKAIEKLVDRLLASPHYGERWASMWMDVSRYAEDQAHIVGNDRSLTFPNAYLYRDWLIKAFNADVPYDRFIKLQLAADVVEPDDQGNHVALGFIGLGPKYYRRNAPEVMADEWEDRVDVVSRGLLGLTVACARCHDHKFDPIATEDYYALAGVFASTEMYNRPLKTLANEPPKIEKRKGKKKRRRNNPDNAMHVIRDGNVRDLPVYIRGNHKTPGAIVKRRFLEVLSPGGVKSFEKGSGRLELANAVIDRNNPLTARVIVNRIWAEHFGQPLVATPSNFGQLGERPTHPRLLDDLAVRFMENGWSLKWLHREIVLSATWRQSSRIADSTSNTKLNPQSAIPNPQSPDPANRLLGRMNRRRLSVEAWRDAVLFVSGRLEQTIGGKSVDPQKPDIRRRTVYSQVSRLELNRMLAMFDHPDPNAHAEKRAETTTTLQKLFVLNSPFMVRQSEAFAKRCVSAGGSDSERILFAYRTAYGREPTAAELQLGLDYLGPEDNGHTARWEQYTQVLLAANEMLMVD